jgi:hypothetical protein
MGPALRHVALSFVAAASLAGFYALTPAAPLQAGAFFSVAFWVSVTLLVLDVVVFSRVPARALKRRAFVVPVGTVYLVFHLFVYGIVLEKILTYAYGAPPYSNGFSLFASFSPYFYPHTLFTSLVQLTVTPSVTVLAPPYYSLSLGPFSFFSAIVIDLLVVANLGTVLSTTVMRGRFAEALGLPLVGVAGGASCCISVPEILTSVSPFYAALLTSPLGIGLLNILYYALPLTVIFVLRANLDILRRVTTRLYIRGSTP